MESEPRPRSVPSEFRRSISAHFAQVHLLARGSTPPQFESGAEAIVFGERGVTVATSDWDEVEVDVVLERTEPLEWPSSSIAVGSSGLEIGNDLAGDSHHVPWPGGPTTIGVERVEAEGRIALVRFHLCNAPSSDIPAR